MVETGILRLLTGDLTRWLKRGFYDKKGEFTVEKLTGQVKTAVASTKKFLS